MTLNYVKKIFVFSKTTLRLFDTIRGFTGFIQDYDIYLRSVIPIIGSSCRARCCTIASNATSL